MNNESAARVDMTHDADDSGEVSATATALAPVVEGEDYYWEGSYMVFTAHFLQRRGYCCESGCRHCPYAGLNEK